MVSSVIDMMNTQIIPRLTSFDGDVDGDEDGDDDGGDVVDLVGLEVGLPEGDLVSPGCNGDRVGEGEGGTSAG